MSYIDPAPTLRELAERLSLVQRWNGRTTIPWSVLQHSILTATLLPADATPYLRLVTLLHDAAEAYTGDIPHGFKMPEQADFEKNILADIYESMDLVPPPKSTSFIGKRVRYVDFFAAVVEAQCIIHPGERRAVWARFDEAYAPNTALVEQGENTLWTMRDMPRRDAVDTWVKAVEKLMNAYLI